MTLGDLLSTTRRLLAEPDSTGRWTDADLTDFINQGQRQLAMAILWPRGTITQSTTSGVGEYALPSLTKVLRVRLAGQLLVPTDISSLEGDQIQLYDQSATDGSMKPQWAVQTNAAFPMLGTPMGYPSGSAAPFVAGMRPMYYLDGGNLGLVPAPAGAYTLSVDVVPFPATLSASADVSEFDYNALLAIAWKVVHLAKFSDSNTDAGDRAAAEYEKQLPILRQWVNNLQGGKPMIPRLLTYRSFYGRTASSRGRDI